MMNISLIPAFLIFLSFANSFAAKSKPDDVAYDKVIMCYFGSWSTYRWASGKFDVEDIDPFLCTHLVFGFAGLDPELYTIKALDPYNELEENWGKGAYKRFTNLKNINPNLVTLLAIGGWNEGATSYSEMVSTPERRATFIQSVVEMIQEHNFDGLDLDWEYPGGRADSPGRPSDKENFGRLIRELRVAFDKAQGNKHLLITAATSAGKDTIDKAYPVKDMAEVLDFIGIMTYDYHGWWGNHTFTGHNSPLYAMPEELDPEHPGYQRNTNFSMYYWNQLGASKDQLLLGLAAYGRGFTLSDPYDYGLYAPANGPIDGGIYTGQAGFWGYNEFCEKMQTEYSQWTFHREEHTVAPYAVNGNNWLSLDDEESIRIKSEYIKKEGFAGTIVWSIDTDDFWGFCTGTKFGLTHMIAEVLNGGEQTVPTDWTPISTTEEEENEDDETSCKDDGDCFINGANPDPRDCSKYCLCTCGTDNKWIKTPQTCPNGLWFNPEFGYCDFPENVDCTPNTFVSSFLRKGGNETVVVDGNNAGVTVPNAMLYLSFSMFLIKIFVY